MPDSYPARERFEQRYLQAAQGRTLIVGSRLYEGRPDRRRLYEDAVGVDMLAGPGVDVVHDLEDGPGELGKFDHVECCSVLEHSRRPWLLAHTIEKVLRRDGTLYISAPWVWRLHSYPGDYWRFSDQAVRELFPSIEWQRLMYASDKLRPDHYVKAETIGEHPYLPRTEVVGFGVRV